MKKNETCVVCGRRIEGTVPVRVAVSDRLYPFCSTICHARFEENPDEFFEKKRRGWKRWFSRLGST